MIDFSEYCVAVEEPDTPKGGQLLYYVIENYMRKKED